MEAGQVDGRGLLVAGGDSSPLLEAVDAPLDGVALLVCLAVKGGRAPASAASPRPVDVLVRPDRDDSPDATAAQVPADRAGRIRLVGQDHVRPCAGRASRAWDAQAGHYFGESRRVVGLSAGQDERQWAAAAVGGKVDLGGQPSAGPADGMVGRFACRGPFLRAPAACW